MLCSHSDRTVLSQVLNKVWSFAFPPNPKSIFKIARRSDSEMMTSLLRFFGLREHLWKKGPVIRR